MVWPVMKPLAGDAKNTAAPAISSGSPMRSKGVSRVRFLRFSGSSHSARAKSVRTSPGAMALTRTLRGPHSTASARASCMSAALLTP